MSKSFKKGRRDRYDEEGYYDKRTEKDFKNRRREKRLKNDLRSGVKDKFTVYDEDEG